MILLGCGRGLTELIRGDLLVLAYDDQPAQETTKDV
jgi:hypothetical protein